MRVVSLGLAGAKNKDGWSPDKKPVRKAVKERLASSSLAQRAQ
jgi:hypothetical protein